MPPALDYMQALPGSIPPGSWQLQAGCVLGEGRGRAGTCPSHFSSLGQLVA